MKEEKQEQQTLTSWQRLRKRISSIEAPDWLSPFMAVAKFILDLADDVLLGIKDFLSVSLHTLHGIMGTTFNVLSGYSAYEAIRDLYRDYWKLYDKDFHKLDGAPRKRRMIRNGINAFIFLGTTGLSIALIIAAWSSLSVIGVAFFPFAITVGLCAASFVKLINLLWDKYELKGQGEHDEINREIKYQAIDFISMLIIVVGLSLATFTAVAGVSLFPFITAPLLMIVFGAALGVVGKFFEFEGPRKLRELPANIVALSHRIYNWFQSRLFGVEVSQKVEKGKGYEKLPMDSNDAENDTPRKLSDGGKEGDLDSRKDSKADEGETNIVSTPTSPIEIPRGSSIDSPTQNQVDITVIASPTISITDSLTGSDESPVEESKADGESRLEAEQPSPTTPSSKGSDLQPSPVPEKGEVKGTWSRRKSDAELLTQCSLGLLAKRERSKSLGDDPSPSKNKPQAEPLKETEKTPTLE